MKLHVLVSCNLQTLAAAKMLDKRFDFDSPLLLELTPLILTGVLKS